MQDDTITQPQSANSAPPVAKEQEQAPVGDVSQGYDASGLEVTDVMGEPLPEDHPARKNPQVGRPVSPGDTGVRWGDGDRDNE